MLRSKGRFRYLDVRQGTDEWLEMRRTGITASEMPVLTGNREGLLDLWSYKRGELDTLQPSDPKLKEMFRLGHLIEPVISEMYTEKTGRKLVRVNRMIASKVHDWAFASLDRVTPDHSRIVELKWAAVKRWDSRPPDYVIDQVQWQMLVSGILVTDVAVLNGGAVEIHEVVADSAYQDDLLAIAIEFRERVKDGNPPSPSGSLADTKALHRIHPVAIEEVDKEPDSQAVSALRRYVVAKKTFDMAEKEHDEAKNSLKAIIGDKGGLQYGKTVVTWLNNKPSEEIDWAEIGHKLIGRLDAYEAVAIREEFKKTVPGARVMRVKGIDEEDLGWM